MTKQITEQFYHAVQLVSEKNPIVHHITNFVTMQDCANLAVAFGASPVMAYYAGEVGEIASHADAVVLNLGTPTPERIDAIFIAGKGANENNVPVVVDPVGLGVSVFRKKSMKALLQQVKPSVIKGNTSEIRALCSAVTSFGKGVDTAHEMDAALMDQSAALAARLQTVIAVSGRQDFITDGRRNCRIDRGSKWLTKISGSGCMATTLTGAFSGVMEDMFYAAVFGILAMDIAGEMAESSLTGNDGPGAFKIKLFDAVSNLKNNTVKNIVAERGIYFEQ